MKAQARILTALADGAATAKEVSELSGVPHGSCKPILSEMKRMGLIDRTHVVAEVIVTRKVSLWSLARVSGEGA
jgi:DNA-binding IclR family transcriptional regulator